MGRISPVLQATFFDGVAHALLTADRKVLSWFHFLILIVVSVLLVFDFYPIKVLRHVILPPMIRPALRLLRLAS